jgi:hypothetical protein
MAETQIDMLIAIKWQIKLGVRVVPKIRTFLLVIAVHKGALLRFLFIFARCGVILPGVGLGIHWWKGCEILQMAFANQSGAVSGIAQHFDKGVGRKR